MGSTHRQAEELVEGGKAHVPVLHLAAGVPDGVDGDQPLPLWRSGSQGHLLLPLAAHFPELVKEPPRQALGVQHCRARSRAVREAPSRPADAPLALPGPPSCGLCSSPHSPITGLHRSHQPVTRGAHWPNKLRVTGCVVSLRNVLFGNMYQGPPLTAAHPKERAGNVKVIQGQTTESLIIMQ